MIRAGVPLPRQARAPRRAGTCCKTGGLAADPGVIHRFLVRAVAAGLGFLG